MDDRGENDRLSRRLANLEAILEERGMVIEHALDRIASLLSEGKQARSEVAVLMAVCADRMREIEKIAGIATEREQSIVELTHENAMLVATARERAEIIARLEIRLSQTGLRFVLERRLRSTANFASRLASALPSLKRKDRIS